MHRKTKNKVFSFLLIVFVLILLITFAELASRLTFPTNKLNSATGIYLNSNTKGWAFKPNAETIFEENIDNKEFSQHVKINSKGLRDYEYKYKKPNGTFRIIMIGNSIIAGLEVPLDSTFENILEVKLGEDYEVLNLAVKAYENQQEIIHLEEEGFKYNPDLIIFNFYTGYDFLKNARSNLYTLEGDKLVKNKIPERKLTNLRNFLSRKSSLYNLLSNLKGEYIKGNNLPENRTVEIYQILKKEEFRETNFKPEITNFTLLNLKKLTKEKNIPLIITIIPMKEQVDKGKLKEAIQTHGMKEEQLDIDWSIRYIEEWGKIESIPIINLQPKMKEKNINNSLYFDVASHLTVEGHKVVGEILHERLISYFQSNS
ncbi:hypothetical protein J4442_01310 [Candidatus Woesearchaeota archaeon]|nr:hypothetical protein [Candidatus Woesearchaeota archaeon]